MRSCGPRLYLLLIATGAFGFTACDSGDLVSGDDTLTAQLVSTNQDTVTPYHLSLLPGNVSNDLTPTITGYASVGDQIKLYPSAHCTGSSTATTMTDSSGVFTVNSPALSLEGQQKFSVLAVHSDGTSDCSAGYATYLLDISGPTISSFPSNQTVGAVPALIQFSLSDSYSALGDLQANNSNGTVSVTGCTGGSADIYAQPSVSIDSTHKPLYKLSLSGGSCNDGDTLRVTLNGQFLRDALGNTATSAATVHADYYLALTSPSITLSRHDNLSTPFNAASSMVLDLAFLHATNGSTTLTTDTSNLAGKVSLAGAISGCHVNVAMNAGVSGGRVTISGCSSNGALSVMIENNLVKNAANIAGSGTTILDLVVDNTGPVIGQTLHANADYIASLSGANTLSFLMSDASGVNPLSATNANGELVISGSCAVAPTATLTTADGTNYVAHLSGGTCADGDSVTVSLDPSKLYDVSGNSDNHDTLAGQTLQYTVDTASQIITQIGGDNGAPTTVGTLNSGAFNLVMTFSKYISGGSAHLYCGPNTGALTEITLPGAFFSTDRSVKWSVSAINSANSSSPFTSGTVCQMDVSGLVDSHGVRVDGSSGTAVVSTFTVP